jgi:hypothetical protein
MRPPRFPELPKGSAAGDRQTGSRTGKLTLADDHDLAALFKHCMGFEPAPRWPPKLREEVRAHMAEVTP